MRRPQANDTIVAVASPPGRAPRGIVRLSGPCALELTNALLRPALTGREGFTARDGRLDLGDGIAAPVRLYRFREPRSYTGEDQCEIHTIGSPPLLDMILERLLCAGARLAEPGEFTRRAFLSGRIHLNQVEAVARIIHAQSEADLKQSVAQLSGHVAHRVTALRDALVHITSRLELDIDFSDQDVRIVSNEEILDELARIAREIESILEAQSSVAHPEDGFPVVLVGPPNAGKSTLFNALSQTRSTIASDRPGTTRDAIAGHAEIDGIPFRFVDTPGLRRARDAIEREAERTAADARSRAVLELLVLDGSTHAVPDEFSQGRGTRKITVINKSDLPRKLEIENAIHASARTGAGVERVKEALVQAVRGPASATRAHTFVPNRRHRAALGAVRESLAHARRSARAAMSPEFIAVDLRAAIGRIKEITGEITTDDVLEAIFADFCIGK